MTFNALPNAPEGEKIFQLNNSGEKVDIKCPVLGLDDQSLEVIKDSGENSDCSGSHTPEFSLRSFGSSRKVMNKKNISTFSKVQKM